MGEVMVVRMLHSLQLCVGISTQHSLIMGEVMVVRMLRSLQLCVGISTQHY